MESYMVELNISSYINFDLHWSQLFELWLKDYCIHYYRNMSLLVVAYFGYPPQYRMVDLLLRPDDFWNFSP